MITEDLPMIHQGVTAAYKAGMESERRFFLEMLAPIFAGYSRAERDPNVRIPSYLEAAIVAARANCVLSTPEQRTVKAAVK